MSASTSAPPRGQSLEEAFEGYAGSMNLQMPLVSFPMHKELKEHVDALTGRLQSAQKKWPSPIANGRWEGLKSYLCVLYRMKIWNADQNKLWRVKELLARISKIGETDKSALPPVAVAMARKLLCINYPPISAGSRALPLPSSDTHQAISSSQMSNPTPQGTPTLLSRPSSSQPAKLPSSSVLKSQASNGIDRDSARAVEAEQQDTVMSTADPITTKGQNLLPSATVSVLAPLLQPTNEIEMEGSADTFTQATTSNTVTSPNTQEIRTLREEIRALSGDNMKLSGWCVGWEHKCKRYEFFVGSLEGLEQKAAGEGAAAATRGSEGFESSKNQYQQAQDHIQMLEEQLKGITTTNVSTYKDLYLQSEQKIKDLEQSVKAGFSDDGTSFKQLLEESVESNKSLEAIIEGTLTADLSNYKDLYLESAEKAKNLEQQVKTGFSDDGTSFQQLFEKSLESNKSIEGALRTAKNNLEVSRDENREQKERILALECAIESTKKTQDNQSECYNRVAKNRIKVLEDRIAVLEKEKTASISRLRSYTAKVNRNADLIAQLERFKVRNKLHEDTIRILKNKAADHLRKHTNCVVPLSSPSVPPAISGQIPDAKLTANEISSRRTLLAKSEKDTLSTKQGFREEIIVLEDLPGSWNEGSADEVPVWVTSSAESIAFAAKFVTNVSKPFYHLLAFVLLLLSSMLYPLVHLCGQLFLLSSSIIEGIWSSTHCCAAVGIMFCCSIIGACGSFLNEKFASSDENFPSGDKTTVNELQWLIDDTVPEFKPLEYGFIAKLVIFCFCCALIMAIIAFADRRAKRLRMETSIMEQEEQAVLQEQAVERERLSIEENRQLWVAAGVKQFREIEARDSKEVDEWLREYAFNRAWGPAINRRKRFRLF